MFGAFYGSAKRRRSPGGSTGRHLRWMFLVLLLLATPTLADGVRMADYFSYKL